MAKHITTAMLNALERQFLVEYERRMRESDDAYARGRINRNTHQYNETCAFHDRCGQNDAIRRLRAMLADDEREATA